MNDVTKIVVGITGLAVLATILVNYTGSVDLVKAISSGYSSSIAQAEKG